MKYLNVNKTITILILHISNLMYPVLKELMHKKARLAITNVNLENIFKRIKTIQIFNLCTNI